jgi:hypothetical protein
MIPNLKFPVSNSAAYVNYVDGMSSSAPEMVTSSSDPQSTIESFRPILKEVSVEEFFGLVGNGDSKGI